MVKLQQIVQSTQTAFEKCTPMMVYVIIALIICFITVALSVSTSMLSQLAANLLTILICSGILYLLCTKLNNQVWAWIFLVVIILSNLGFIYTTFKSGIMAVTTGITN